MPRTLILGGTRNLGHVTAHLLLERGHDVTILNRGHTPDALPQDIERLRADRNDTASVNAAIGNRSFDLILDNTTYTEADAQQAVGVFHGRVGKYVFISSGQVYLVRADIRRPFVEDDYEGPVMPEPAKESADHPSWLYGADKRLAEQVFADAHSVLDFPVTTVRLPMVASERDHYGRIQGYVARLLDGHPLIIPDGKALPLRHVYVSDVARAVTHLAGTEKGIGEAFNISYGQSVTLEDFFRLLAGASGKSPRMVTAERRKLEEAGLLPDCSPFSGRWMSELDNSRSIGAFHLEFTPPEDYLPSIVSDYVDRWKSHGLVPEGYLQRDRELAFLAGQNKGR